MESMSELFSDILWHGDRKTNAEEWSAAVRAGRLVDAGKRVHPGKSRGPWKVFYDNEFCWHADLSRATHRRHNIQLIQMPSKSPDLNPVKKMWGWARKRLRERDLADLSGGRPVLGKTTYRQRVRLLLNIADAKRVATKLFKHLHKVATKASAAKGAAVKG